MNKQKMSVLILLALAQFILTLDSTIMNVSLSTLVVDLHTSVTNLQGAIALYSLVMAALMIAGAKIGDIIGRKKALLIGLALYGLGALVTGISWNINILFFGWSFLEGVGAALTMPALYSIVVANFCEGKERVKAYGIIAAMAAAGAALGPIIGGFLTAFVSWRIAFFAEVLIVIYILLNYKKIKDATIVLINNKFDYVGFLFSALGLVTIVFGILLSNIYGIIKASKAFVIAGKVLIEKGGVSPTIWFILIGIVILLIFIIWEAYRTKNNKATLINPKIFKNKVVLFGITTTLAYQFILAGTMFAISIVAQIIFEFNAFNSGLMLLPLSLAVLLAATLIDKIAQKAPPKRLIQIGMVLILIGTGLVGVLLHKYPDSLIFIVGLFIIGIGIGIAASMLNNLIISSVSSEQTSEASGINNTFSSLGSSLGTAIAGSLIISIFMTSSVNLIEKNSVFTSDQKSHLIESVDTKAQTMSNSDLSQYLVSAPINIKNEIIKINTEAENNATSATIIALAIIGIIGLMSSSLLPKRKAKNNN